MVSSVSFNENERFESKCFVSKETGHSSKSNGMQLFLCATEQDECARIIVKRNLKKKIILLLSSSHNVLSFLLRSLFDISSKLRDGRREADAEITNYRKFRHNVTLYAKCCHNLAR